MDEGLPRVGELISITWHMGNQYAPSPFPTLLGLQVISVTDEAVTAEWREIIADIDIWPGKTETWDLE